MNKLDPNKLFNIFNASDETIYEEHNITFVRKPVCINGYGGERVRELLYHRWNVHDEI
jgi:hypothetical protein